MPDKEHLAILNRGVEAWNQWRDEHPDIEPDLTRAILTGRDLAKASLDKSNLRGAILAQADLTEADLGKACLEKAFLTGANLTGACLGKANLCMAELARATLVHADLIGADLHVANLAEADLCEADLIQADLTGAHLREAILSRAFLADATLVRATLQSAILVETNFERANLRGCSVYGISAWNVKLAGAQQADLVITPDGEPAITADNLEVAQFIYLLLHNEKIRHVIETVTSKAVLILGRFEPPERKAVLDALREALRKRDRLPIMFDFTLPRTQTTLETVSTLAHMARFVIADLTDAKSVLQELHAIVPNSPSVLIQPLLLASQEEPGMFDFFRRFDSVLEIYRYHSQEEVLASLDAKILAPAEAKVRELTELWRAQAEAQLNPQPAPS